MADQVGIFSDSWHIKSRGMFAGSCIGVMFLVITLELLRRLQREHNSVIQRQNQRPVAGGSAKRGSSASEEEGRNLNDDASSARSRAGLRVNPVSRMTLLKQQLVRAAIHTLQFGVAYIIMLIAMSFNGEFPRSAIDKLILILIGYLIICILIGAFLGSLAFSFDQICYP